jgi:ribosomal protein L22
MAKNTEKPTTKQEAKKSGVVKPLKKTKVLNEVKTKKSQIKKPAENKKLQEIKKETSPQKIETSKVKKEVPKKEIKKIKKSEVTVKGVSVPISTKYSVSICRFIKNKKIEKAIKKLGEVLKFKRAIPMRGEIPHRKGKIMSGRYPKNATEHFIKLLKSLKSNADNHDVEDPVIFEAIANTAQRPFGRFGRVKRKRTHILIKAKSIKRKEKEKKNGREKNSSV